MKYRIVHAFPHGYKIQQRFLGLFWEDTGLYNTLTGDDWRFGTVESAQDAIEVLKKTGKPVVGTYKEKH